MIARITRILLLLQLAVALLLALAIVHRWPRVPLLAATLLGIGCILLVRAVIVANNFRVASRFPCNPTAPVLTAAAFLRMYLEELVATLVSSSWHMPFFRLAAMPAVLGCGTPVLLIHGYGCNSGYWQPLARALRAARISHHAVNLEPVLGDIDCYLAQVSHAVDSLCAATGAVQVVIVAHSMGGLVARSWLRANGWQHVAGLITLGTPHQGTALAQFGIGTNARQMCPSDQAGGAGCNPWLATLNAETAERREQIMSIYSMHDNIIAPATSSCLAGTREVAFDGIGHVALASRPAVIACVIERIREIERSCATPGAPAQSISIQLNPSS